MVEVLGAVVGVVVLDLVVVPRGDPRHGRVCGLQVRIGLVLAIPRAVVRKRVGLMDVVLAHVLPAPRRFVDVVAEEHHEVEVVLEHVAVGAEVALLIVLAGCEGEPQLVGLCRRARRRARASDRAGGVPGSEAVPVPACRLQSADLDVHGMRPVRAGVGRPRGHDLAHALVAGHLPADRHYLGRHAAAGGVGHGRQPGPQHDAVRERVPRGHPEAEGVGRKARVRLELGARGGQRGSEAQRGEGLQEAAAVGEVHPASLTRQHDGRLTSRYRAACRHTAWPMSPGLISPIRRICVFPTCFSPRIGCVLNTEEKRG